MIGNFNGYPLITWQERCILRFSWHLKKTECETTIKSKNKRTLSFLLFKQFGWKNTTTQGFCVLVVFFHFLYKNKKLSLQAQPAIWRIWLRLTRVTQRDSQAQQKRDSFCWAACYKTTSFGPLRSSFRSALPEPNNTSSSEKHRKCTHTYDDTNAATMREGEGGKTWHEKEGSLFAEE